MALDVLDIDFSGTTDANGNLTIVKVPSPAFWVNLKVVAQLTGSAIWVIQVNSRAVTFGRGPRVDLGPILLQPKDSLSVQVIGAQANVALTGKLLGVTAPTVQELLSNFAMVPNTIALDVGAPQTVITTIKGPANTTVGPTTFLVPPGTQSIGYLVRSDAGNDTPRGVTIQGATSLNDYSQATPLNNVGGPQWFPFAATDTAVSVTLLTNGVNPSAIDLLASPLVEVLDVQQTFGEVINAQLTDNGGNSVAIDSGVGAQRLLGVSMTEAVPAPWQGANLPPIEINANMAAGPSTLVLLAAAAGIVHLLYCVVSYDAVGGQVRLQDTNGIEYHAFGGVASATPPPFMGFGSALPSGRGVQLVNPTGAGAVTVRGSLIVSRV